MVFLHASVLLNRMPLIGDCQKPSFNCLSSGYIHKDHGAAKYLRHLLPGAVEISWPSPLAAQTTQVLESQTFAAAAAIRGELKKCAAEGRHRLSVRALKMRLGLPLGWGDGAFAGRRGLVVAY